MTRALRPCCIMLAFFVPAAWASESARLEDNRWASGVSQPPPGPITAMAASGKHLYVAGEFSTVKGVLCRRVAHWNGTAWFPMGGGIKGSIRAIAVSGSNVYVAGALSKAFQADGSPIAISNICRWNGQRWSPMAGGTDGDINDMCVVGTNLYAAGSFRRAGGVLSPGVACWNGVRWSGISTNSNAIMSPLATDGTNLFIAGFTQDFSGAWNNTIARWDGTNWFPLGPLEGITDMAWHRGELYAISQVGGAITWNIMAKWNGAQWLPVDSALVGAGTRRTFVSSGSDIYLLDRNVIDPPDQRDSIFRRDKCGWAALPDQLLNYPYDKQAQAMVMYQGRLLVGGSFQSIGNRPVKWLARWGAGDWPRLTAETEPAAEGTTTNGLLTVRLSLCPEPSEPVRIKFETKNGTALAGKDYRSISGTFIADPDKPPEYLINVPLLADDIYEPNKTFRVMLSSTNRVLLVQTQVVCTITNDDPLPKMFVSDLEKFEGDAGTNRFNFKISLSGAMSSPFNVHCIFEHSSPIDGDAVPFFVPDPITIPAGATNAIFPVDVYGDRIRESNRVFCIRCWSSYGHEFVKPVGCGTILNDDVFPGLGMNPYFTFGRGYFSFFEGDYSSTQTLRLSLSAAFTNETSFGYSASDRTARSGQDYLLPPGRAVIPAGSTFYDLPIVVFGDLWKEPNEEFVVNLSTPTNLLLGQTQIVCTIWNDDRYALPRGFAFSTVASNLEFATAFDVAPDGRIFVCQQTGEILLIRDGVVSAKPFLRIDVTTEGYAEAGLLGITLDPGFHANGFFYVYHTVRTNWQTGPWNRISRFTAGQDEAVAGSEVVLLNLDRLSSARIHNGGGIQFGPDGMLYIGVGENGNGENAQSLTNLLGKILRIAPDGRIPADNPFFSVLSGPLRAIWAYGLRNPFRFAIQPGLGRILINDVGWNTWEEINNGKAGANYGWPITEGKSTDARFTKPIFVYGHGDDETNGCSILGGTFYNPARANFPTQYVGSYFFGDYCRNWIRQMTFTNGAVAHPFADGFPGPVDLKVAQDGSLYCLSRGFSDYGGSLSRIFVPEGESRFESIRCTPEHTVRARFTAPEATRFELQASSDLQTWHLATNGIVRHSPVDISVPGSDRPATFYRLAHDYLLNDGH